MIQVHQAGVIIVYVFLQCKWTSLHRASQKGHYQVAELLLQAGASVEQKTVVRWSVIVLWLNNLHCTLYMCMLQGRFLNVALLYPMPIKVGFSTEKLIHLLSSLSANKGQAM